MSGRAAHSVVAAGVGALGSGVGSRCEGRRAGRGGVRSRIALAAGRPVDFGRSAGDSLRTGRLERLGVDPRQAALPWENRLTWVSEDLSLAEDPVHLGTADGARALGHTSARLADLHLAVKVTLLFALHAVAVVALSHGVLHVSTGAGPGAAQAGWRAAIRVVSVAVCGALTPPAGFGRGGGPPQGAPRVVAAPSRGCP